MSTSANFDFGQFLDVEFGLRQNGTKHGEGEEEKEKHTEMKGRGTVKKVRFCVKASPGRRRFHTKTAYVRLSGFNRPSCGAGWPAMLH